MGKPLICLTLTCPTLQQNAEIVEKYLKYIDIAELRVDFLTEDEQLEVRKFPSMIKIPCILTIRRISDGGKYDSSEFSRTALFGRALAFADRNPAKNYAYVDFEEDFHVPSLEDAALAFGVKIIRSCHKFDGPVDNIQEKFESMRKTGFEIPKIVFTPNNLTDITRLFRDTENFKSFDHIVCPTGALGTPARILTYKTNSYITYTSPRETINNIKNSGHLDPITLNDLFNFRAISETTKINAITGGLNISQSSLLLLNAGFRSHGMDRVFIPIPSTSIPESLQFAEQLGIDGMCISVPYNKEVIYDLEELDPETAEINACNTIIQKNGVWIGHDTYAAGFRHALSEFLGYPKLRHKKVAILGAGGAAHAIAYTIKQMGGRACVFNRTISKARILAERYNFDYAPLGVEGLQTLEKYSDIIIQTSSVGQNIGSIPQKEDNPIWFYQFKGHEQVFDVVYSLNQTPILKAAAEAGCKITNGLQMLKYQSYRQFKYFTGQEYETLGLHKI